MVGKELENYKIEKLLKGLEDNLGCSCHGKSMEVWSFEPKIVIIANDFELVYSGEIEDILDNELIIRQLAVLFDKPENEIQSIFDEVKEYSGDSEIESSDSFSSFNKVTDDDSEDVTYEEAKQFTLDSIPIIFNGILSNLSNVKLPFVYGEITMKTPKDNVIDMGRFEAVYTDWSGRIRNFLREDNKIVGENFYKFVDYVNSFKNSEELDPKDSKDKDEELLNEVNNGSPDEDSIEEEVNDEQLKEPVKEKVNNELDNDVTPSIKIGVSDLKGLSSFSVL